MNALAFTYAGLPVRTGETADPSWFVARDVCAVLGITWSGATLAAIRTDWKGMLKLNTPGGEQEFAAITEAALYKLAFRSNKPEAEAFTDWVAAEVLPAIRKTGRYEVSPAPALDFSDPLVAAQLYIKAESERRAAVEKNNRLALAVSALQPKAAFADAVRFGEADMNIGTFAKIIRVKHLFEWLRERRYLYHRAGHNVPFAQFGEDGQGLFTVKMVPKAGRMYPVTSVTGKGQLRIALELGVGVQPVLALAGGKLEPSGGVNPQQQKTG